MVVFNTENYTPAEKALHEAMSDNAPRKRLEDPIIPMNEIGATVSEQFSNQRFKNLVQGVQADLRRGIGKLQIVMDTPHTSPIGGRAKGYGPEIREKLREVVLANNAMIVGIELPTSLSNLSGLNMQQGTVSEEERRKELDEVRDAIKFTADVAQGGSVDILSWEFPRALMDAKWNHEGKWAGAFKVPGEKEIFEINLVDTRTGAIARAPNKGIPNPYTQKEIEEFEKKNDWRKKTSWDWEDFKKLAEQNKEAGKTKKEGNDPNEISDPYGIVKMTLFNKQITSAEAQIARRKGEINQHEEIIENITDKIEQLKKLKTKEDDPHFKKLKQKKEDYTSYIKSFEEDIEDLRRTVNEQKERQAHLKPLPVFAKENSVKSYAEAGIMAMNETHSNKNIKRPVYVGPEIGWPQFYGSHPQEFIELIHGARDEMVKMLTDPKSPHYDEGLSKKEAEEQAELHLKGTFDTSHMGMWLEKFKPDEPWDKRVKEFDKWYMEQVKNLAKENVVGTIQLVNSMSAAHGHNPPGEGIFPVVQAAKEFKKQGFNGYFISEGHDEERFGEGRIITKAWEAFNSPIETKYGPGASPRTWSDINQGYFAMTYSPRMMFGQYTPPMAEYKPWAGGKNPITFE